MENVSVIIPNYNRCGLVNETVRNVLGQTLPPHEVIVVDDGSTDNSVDSLAGEFGDRIQLITQKNQGPGAARNVGLDRATGDFIWLMDSDDIASLNKLEVQVRALQEHAADVVYGPWARVFFDGCTVRLECQVLQQKPLPDSHDILTWFVSDWSLVFQSCLFRSKTLRAAGNYRTDIWTCDDSEYFARILSTGATAIYDARSITLYRCDDHGKVTGSGFHDTRRIIDWGHCLLATYDLCAGLGKQRLPGLQTRIWESVRELQHHAPQEESLISELNNRLHIGVVAACLRSYAKRLRRAIRTRCGGEHWPVAYQTASLNTAQEQLIEDLGFEVVQ